MHNRKCLRGEESTSQGERDVVSQLRQLFTTLSGYAIQVDSNRLILFLLSSACTTHTIVYSYLIFMSSDFHGRVGEAKVSDCDLHGTITSRA